MKKRLYSLVLGLALWLGASPAMAQLGGLDLGEALANISNPQNWYYVNLTAKNSTTSGGSGKVKLMPCDLYGNIIYDQYMIQDIPEDLQTTLWPAGDPKNSEFAAQPSQNSFSLIYMPGVEIEGGGMMLSTYAYFAGWAKADDGSYFAGWSYIDGGTDLGMGGSEEDYETEEVEQEDYTMKTVTKNNYAMFRILPDEVTGYSPIGTQRTVYATFRPVQVVSYRAYTGTVEAVEDEEGYPGIDVKVSGLNIDDDDFNDPIVAGTDRGWALAANEEDGYKGWGYDEEMGILIIDLIYTAQADVEIGQEYSTTVTVSTKSGSTIVVPVTVRAVDPDLDEATLLIGEDEQSGSWIDMLAAANAAVGQPVVLTLNADIEELQETQVFSNTMTFNPNGYTLQSSTVIPMTIAGGVVTMAYSKYGGGVNGNGDVAIDVQSGELVLDGGDVNGDIIVSEGAKLIQNGADIWGTVLNAGTTQIKDGTIEVGDNKNYAVRSTGTLIVEGGEINGGYEVTDFDNNHVEMGAAVYVEAGTALIKKGVIKSYEVAVLSKGTTTIEKLAELIIEEEEEEFIPESPARAIREDEPEDEAGVALVVKGGVTTVNCGKFNALVAFHTTAGTLNFVSGFFTTMEDESIPTDKKVWNLATGPEFRSGYRYFVGDDAAQKAAGVAICTIGDVGYTSLEDALAYANNNKSKDVVIVLRGDYTLPAGFFTLPKNAMLLIPYEETQETGSEIISRVVKNSLQNVDYIKPYEFRRLTLAEGSHLDVYGKIEVSGRQFASDEAYAAVPYGAYGCIQMNESSSMTLQSGALLRVWGYVIGKGEIDVRRGATVREQFQMGDWKGGSTSMNMLDDPRHVFPLTQYYIQSVEAPTKYHAGAVLSTATAVSAALGGMPLVATANDIKIVGIQGQDDAMFLMSMAADEENTWVRKWYDIENDIQTYEVYSSAHIGSMVLDLGKIGGQDMQMHSGWFNLPITNNMKIHLLYGYMDFTQNTELLPGAEVEIDKESTVTIVNTPGVASGKLYIYDADDWGTYAYDGSGLTKTKTVKYSPSWNGVPTVRDLNRVEDAKINVHGTFDTFDGYVLTSVHGANIFSNNNDAGTFTFSKEALAADHSEEVYQVRGRTEYESKTFISAQLKNAEGQTPAFATTGGTDEGKSYCYINGRWTLMDIDENNPNFMVDNYGDLYAKPNAYVAVNATWNGSEYVGNTDHTFSGKYEQGRLFILIPNDGQWWEVTVKDNLYYCADKDMYYVWNEDEQKWMEKKFKIYWQNWDGTPLTFKNSADEDVNYYEVPYGTMAEYRSSNPEREATVDYTYDFTGWSPALGRVTTDVTYTATYTTKPRQYTIVFQTEGGAEIERQFLVRDEFPICENEPTKPGHILKWEPALAAVTGDATYTATWLAEKPATWNIRFVNYNGVELQSSEVVAGTMPEAPATPTKDETREFTYNFIGWKPALEEATRDLTYTAQFEEAPKTFAITFTDEYNNVLGEVQYLTYGAAPVVPNYTKEATAQYTYTVDWDPKVVAVSGNQTYKATVTPTTNKYTVTCKGEGCIFTGAGVYEYGATPTITVTADEGYENATWLNGPATNYTVTGNAVFTASATATTATPKFESLTMDVNSVVDKNGAYEQLMNLTLTSNGTQSADLRGAENLTVMGAANYDLIESMSERTWYAVAVPWEVNADNGIYTRNNKHLELGVDIDVVYYDGAERAQHGPTDACWKYVELSNDHTLHPGTLYMVYLLHSQNGLRFQKKAGANIHYNGSVHVTPYDAAEETDRNWNGIANPATYHATLSTGAIDGQFYDGEGYLPIPLAGKEFIVGEPVFVQVPEPQSVVVNKTTIGAPIRVQEASTPRYDVQIAANGVMADRVIVATEQDKADEYVIVKDLVKMGVSTKKAQMWIDRYDAKLCVNTVDAENAEFPLSIYAPATGQYSLSTSTPEGGLNMYLTYNGQAIANLSNGDYTITLQEGTHVSYGLRISNTPGVATSIDEALVDAQSVEKVVINNMFYIIRDGHMFTADGQLVK